MTRIYRNPKEQVAMGTLKLLLCCTVFLVQYSFVHGFSATNLVVTNHAGVLSRQESSSTLQMRNRRIPATTRLLASKPANSAAERSTVATTTATTASSATASSATASSLTPSSALNPIEAWCTTHMNVWYDKSLAVKCPFFRRRMTDLLDGADLVMRFLVIRHKSLDLIGPPPGCRSARATGTKHKHQSLEAVMDTIRADWTGTPAPSPRSSSSSPYQSNRIQQPQPPQPRDAKAHKGYYITGRLNTTIYRDDCWFDGPDPDMPVRGVRKYLNAASQLFDVSASTAELLSLDMGNDDTIHNKHKRKRTKATIVAHWKLKGVLRLPWKPSLPVWTGSTTYHLDEDHLVYFHEEHWDISMIQAFTQTLWPELGNRLWKPSIMAEYESESETESGDSDTEREGERIPSMI